MPFAAHMPTEGHTHTPAHAVEANQKFPLLSPPTSPLHSSALWHITQQHQLPDTSYQDRFGGLLIRPLKKSFLSMKGDVTPIPKAEEGGEVMRAWQSKQPNWPCVPVLGGSPDTFFFLSSGWRVWKHPPHRHRGRTIYSFIVEVSRSVDHRAEKWKLWKKIRKGMQKIRKIFNKSFYSWPLHIVCCFVEHSTAWMTFQFLFCMPLDNKEH